MTELKNLPDLPWDQLVGFARAIMANSGASGTIEPGFAQEVCKDIHKIANKFADRKLAHNSISATIKKVAKNSKESEEKMYSKNVIFMDGEFTDLRADGTQFISIALVKPNGEEYYAINADYNSKRVSEWVRENVLIPLYTDTVHGDMRNKCTALDFHKIYGKPEKQIANEIKAFVGNSKPYLVADVNQFDWMGICRLFGVWDVPFYYIPIDFASILWSKGIDPDVDRIKLAEKNGIDVSNFKKHLALDDTRVLKALYEKLS